MGIVIPKKWQNLVAVMVEHYEVRDSSLVFFWISSCSAVFHFSLSFISFPAFISCNLACHQLAF